jgi:hypothetical protein
MGLKRFVPEEDLFEQIFSSNQVGNGALGRYRGSDLQNGAGLGNFLRTLFSRVAKFATPLVRSAAPHLRAGLASATPHLREAAKSVLTETGNHLARKVSNLFDTTSEQQQQQQSGTGRKRKAISKKPHNPRRRKTIKLSRVAPYDLPDSF